MKNLAIFELPLITAISGFILIMLSFVAQAEDIDCKTDTGLNVPSLWRDYPSIISVNNVTMIHLNTRYPSPGKEIAVYELMYTPTKAIVTIQDSVWHVVMPGAYSNENYICSRSFRTVK